MSNNTDNINNDMALYNNSNTDIEDNIIGITINNIGRPIKYEGSITDNKVYKLCLLGATDKEIADIIGIAEATLYEWKNKYISLSEAMKRGKREADAEVAESLYKKATGKLKTTEIKESVDKDGNIERTITEKENMPDTVAQIFWLKNRDPNRWKDKQEIDNNVSVKTLQILPPEE